MYLILYPKSSVIFWTHCAYIFTQERINVIFAMGIHKKISISRTYWIFSILMFHVIIFNNRNQLKTYKIELQFILVLSKLKIVDSTYKLVILIIYLTAVVFDRVCLFVTKLSYMLCSVIYIDSASLINSWFIIFS